MVNQRWKNVDCGWLSPNQRADDLNYCVFKREIQMNATVGSFFKGLLLKDKSHTGRIWVKILIMNTSYRYIS